MAKEDAKLDATARLVSVNDEQVTLTSPVTMPKANGYLYNDKMLLQLNCRGYAISQFLQPEPAKYSFGPNLEATTFIQPEHHYYAHHPGRFFYLKDLITGELISLPYEPCRKRTDSFAFIQEKGQISWRISHNDLNINIRVSLCNAHIAECWHISIVNQSDSVKRIALYPYFTVGYQSWMNQSADYDETLYAIIASAITPYQKVSQYFENQELKDKTFLISERSPDAWLANQELFEGEGGLSNPTALGQRSLPNCGTQYQVACAAMQYDIELAPNEAFENKWAFGAAKNVDEIDAIKRVAFSDESSIAPSLSVNVSIQEHTGIIGSESWLFNYINTWLPRQIDMHGTTNRLTTDPQTRNYLQDNMGLSFLAPTKARRAFVRTMSQQHASGELPDGILLNETAELKYINQVPHSDHSAWLSISLLCYLDETNDTELLLEQLDFQDSDEQAPVYLHLTKSIEYLLAQRDERGLCFINQGDWCDPMNMVGHNGKGVSSWLSLATAYSIECFIRLINDYLPENLQGSLADKIAEFKEAKTALNNAVNTHCWDGDWYARGINDHGRSFGIKSDVEGRIYLNPQSWALLAEAVSPAKQYSLLNEVQKQLYTPFGVTMLAPSYTQMDEGIGRLTQKSAGIAENGSVYNHASVFYAYSLYQIGENDMAFAVLAKMLPTETDQIIRGQLPHFVPNYYRGAYHQLPEHAGKSSHLFNTGTVAWFYRCIVEELCGLKGKQGRLLVQPKLPKHLTRLSGTRHFRGADINFEYQQKDIESMQCWLNGTPLDKPVICNVESGARYQLEVHLPRKHLE